MFKKRIKKENSIYYTTHTSEYLSRFGIVRLTAQTVLMLMPLLWLRLRMMRGMLIPEPELALLLLLLFLLLLLLLMLGCRCRCRVTLEVALGDRGRRPIGSAISQQQ